MLTGTATSLSLLKDDAIWTHASPHIQTQIYMPQGMATDQRIDLIIEAVIYCQKVMRMGMPASCYTKALREPVFFLWETRYSRKKYEAAMFCSKMAMGLRPGNAEVVYDHAVPFVYLQRELLNLEVIDKKSVQSALERYGLACLITKEEDAKISKFGLQRTMPNGWDGSDLLARYRAVGIEVVPNPQYVGLRV